MERWHVFQLLPNILTKMRTVAQPSFLSASHLRKRNRSKHREIESPERKLKRRFDSLNFHELNMLNSSRQQQQLKDEKPVMNSHYNAWLNR